MLKKAIPLFLLSGLVLVGCNGNNDNGAVPGNNETPMEDVQDRDRNWTPNVRDDQGGGTNLDGIDNGDNDNGGMMNTPINDDTIIDENNQNRNRNNR